MAPGDSESNKGVLGEKSSALYSRQMPKLPHEHHASAKQCLCSGAKNDCHKFVTWAAALRGGSGDRVNLGRNGWAGAEPRMVPQEEMPVLLPVNAENEYIFRRPFAAFLG